MRSVEPLVAQYRVEDLGDQSTPTDSFYDGPIGAAHSPMANAAVIDSDDDVLLLRPLSDGNGLDVCPSERPQADAPTPAQFVSATVWSHT